MQPTDVHICNLALFRAGSTAEIDSLDEKTNEAGLCKRLFVHHRDGLLAAHPWPFATRRAVLAELASVSREGWARCFALPSDCLHARYIWNGLRRSRPEQRFPFAIEDNGDARILLADAEPPVTLVYTARIESASLFPPAFREALAWAIAVDLVLALRKDGSLYAQAKQEAEIAKQRAIAQAINEQVPDEEPPSRIEAMYHGLRRSRRHC